MKPITFTTSSLLYRLAAVYGPFNKFSLVNGDVDSCHLIRGMMWGVFKITWMVALASALLLPPTILIMWGIGWHVTGVNVLRYYAIPKDGFDLFTPLVGGTWGNNFGVLLNLIAILEALALVVVVIALIGYGISCLLGKKATKQAASFIASKMPTVTLPTPVTQLYDSWKHKYCVPVKVIDVGRDDDDD